MQKRGAGYLLALDAEGNVYSSGTPADSTDFDPGPGTFFLQTQSNVNFFLHKMDSSGNLVWAYVFGSTNSQTSGGLVVDAHRNILMAGNNDGTFDLDPGGGTANINTLGGRDGFVVKWNQCPPEGATVNISACDGLWSPSGQQFWTQSGTYWDIISSTMGCDSILTIQLDIQQSTQSNLSSSSCGPFLSPSGHHVWDVSGSYLDTIPNIAGCDSILTCQLTITTMDTAVSLTGATLTSHAVGATYQWIDCSSGYVLPGETGQVFQPTQNGSYAVVVSQGGCSDTSGCHSIDSIVALTETTAIDFSFSPNPTEGRVVLQLSTSAASVKVEILSVFGETIAQYQSLGANTWALDIPGPGGLYSLRVWVDEHPPGTFKVLKK